MPLWSKSWSPLTENPYVGLNKSNGSQSMSILAKLNTIGVIALKKETFDLIAQKYPDKKIIAIDPLQHQTLELSEETHLLTENITDGLFYSKISERGLRHKYKLSGKGNICFLKRNGGGLTIASVYEQELKSKSHFCIVIADSDKRHPDSDFGTTAKGIQACHNKYQHPFADIYIMNEVSEIENFIPNAILSEYGKSVKDLQYIVKKDLSYFDIKKGLTVAMLKYPKCNEYWKKIMIEKPIKSPKDYESIDSKEQVVRGWGDSIMSDFLSKNDNQKLISVISETQLSDAQRHEWYNISNAIINWCLAAPPTRL